MPPLRSTAVACSLALLLSAAGGARAATYTVINTNQSGAGSFRQAILNANSNAGPDTISFNLTNNFSIRPTNALPTITGQVTIDGYTQSGSSAATSCTSNNAVIKIRLDGSLMATNADGLRITASNSIIRGLVIVNFPQDGIEIAGGTNNQVTGCFIGIETNGVTPAGNSQSGVNIVGGSTSRNRIGGTTAAERNVISANESGVSISSSPRNVILGNLIGTDAAGTVDRGNQSSGVMITGTTATNNVVGSTNACGRNIISGNVHGVFIGAARNSVVGNIIGLDVSGTLPLGNESLGVVLEGGVSNLIGGTLSVERNVISANGIGVSLAWSSHSNAIAGNLIGTDITGAGTLGNTAHGVVLSDAAYNLISNNVVSGNAGQGIWIDATETSPGNRILRNFVGTDVSGTLNLANNGTGIIIEQSDTRVGGTNGEGNVVAYNLDRGITVAYFNSRVALLGNSVFSNSGMGIDLFTDWSGPDINDPGDGDDGANGGQNFPVLTQVLQFPAKTAVAGTFNSRSNTVYRLEFFRNVDVDETGYGEGRTYLGFTNVATDALGNVDFVFNHPAAIPVGQFITATATDPSTNTSEFSAVQMVVPFDSADVSISLTDSADPAPRSATFTYTLTVINTGPTNATGVVVTNTLPPMLQFVSASASQGTCTHTSGVVTCNLGAIPNDGLATIVIEVQGATNGLAINQATVGASQQDLFPGNNIATESTWVGLADLAVAIQDSPDPVVAGQVLTNVVTITNAGPDDAASVALDFNLAVDVVPVDAAASQGTFALDGSAFRYFAGTIPVGGTATFTVRAIPTVAGVLEHTPFVESAEQDPDFGNNYETEETTVVEGPGILLFSEPQLTVNESVESLTVSVQRIGGAIGPVTVDYAASNATAIAGSDFVAAGGTLTFTNGELTRTFTVSIQDDSDVECNELFTLRLFNPAGGALALVRTNIPATIVDNDLVADGVLQGISLSPTNQLTAGQAVSSVHVSVNDGLISAVSDDGRYVVFSSVADNLVSHPDPNGGGDIFLHDRLTGSNVLVSVNASGTAAGNAPSEIAGISANGQVIVFTSVATDLTTNAVSGADPQLFAFDRLSGVMQLVSANPDGTGSGQPVSSFSISSNGMRIAFESAAETLSPLDGNGWPDVFVRDLQAGTTILVSIDTNEISANYTSGKPSISADGRFVAFYSGATSLSPQDGGLQTDIYLRDLDLGTTALVSVNTNGAASGITCGEYSRVSGDGRYVVFDSPALDLAAGITNGGNVFVRDVIGGVTEIVSIGNNNALPPELTLLRHRAVSRDGRFVLFEASAGNLAPNDTNGVVDVFLRDTWSNTTAVVSTKLGGGGTGSRESHDSVMSPDGRYVAFSSYATNLTANSEPLESFDVFARDMISGTTTLLNTERGTNTTAYGFSQPFSVSAGGVVVFNSDSADIAAFDRNFATDVFARPAGASTPPELVSHGYSSTGDGNSFEAQISADGGSIVFVTDAGNLGPRENNYDSDVYVRRVADGAMILISVNTNNTGTGNSFSSEPQISANGRYVAFASHSSDLVANDGNGAGDVFRRDTLLGVTEVVSANHVNGGVGNDSASDPVMTPDGRYVAFHSVATNLVPNDSNGGIGDIFIRDLATNTVELVSVTPGGGSADAYSYDPVVSGDGRFVAFESQASDLGPSDANGRFDIYVRDRAGNTNILCSRNLAGNDGGSDLSFDPVLSADGSRVIFASHATNLLAGDTNLTTDLFAYHLPSHTLELVTRNLAGGFARNGGHAGRVSANGRYVAFSSLSPDLTLNDTNQALDVFVRDLVADTTTLVSVNCDGARTGNSDSLSPEISADGRYVVFESYATDLVAGEYVPGTINVFRRDLQTGSTELISRNRMNTGAGNNASSQGRMSADAATVVFASEASDLVMNDANNALDVFLWQSAGSALVDLLLAKTASINSIPEWSNFTYTLTVTNIGASGATGVTVTDPLPPAVSFVSASASQGAVTNAGGIIQAQLGAVGMGAGASILITVTATNVGFATNFAMAASVETDVNPANNAASAIVLITPLAPPQLSILATNAGQLLIAWPNTTPSIYGLETTTNLLPLTIWVPVTNAVSNDGALKYILLNIDPLEPTRFYRLKR